MPRSVTLAKPKNKGKSYTTFLKTIVREEWLRLIQLKHLHAPHPLRECLFTATCWLPLPLPLPLQQLMQTPLALPHNVWASQPYDSTPTPVPKPPIHSHPHAYHRWQPTRHRWLPSVVLLPVWSDWLRNAPSLGMPYNIPCRIRFDLTRHKSPL